MVQMKSRIVFFFGLFIVISILISCNKDNNPPVITILGSNPMNHCILETDDTIIYLEYIDPGATAIDEEDGDISDKINTTINVNTEVEGTYMVSYTVEDNAGNAAAATRTVDVIYCK